MGAPMPVGVMFFADPARSFANLRKGLKSGGRLAFASWREAYDLDLDIAIGRGLDRAVAAALAIGRRAARSPRRRDLDRDLGQFRRARLWGALRAQKRPHGEIRLAQAISVGCTDRAGAPRPASRAHVVRAGRVLEMAGAGSDVVAAA
jgi:hypothetical protein